MATATLTETRLRLAFEVGMNEKGEPVYKTKTLNNINPAATTDQLLQAAQALGVLCSDPLSSIKRADSSDIIA